MDPPDRDAIENLRLAVERQRGVDDLPRIAEEFTHEERDREAELSRLDACDRLLAEAEEAFGVGGSERTAAKDRADVLMATVSGYLRDNPR